MNKFASIVSLSLAAIGLAAGCSVEAVDSEEFTDFTGEAAGECNNVNGTNAMIASLAVNIGIDLGRIDILKDFEIYRGTYYQEMLRIRSSAMGRCKNSCRNIKGILAFQEPELDQQWIWKGGTKLSTWNFASRLVTGYRNQQTCEARSLTDVNTCKGAEDHFLEMKSMADATCNGVDYGLSLVDFTTTRGAAGGGELTPNPGADVPLTDPTKLKRKLLWAHVGTGTPNETIAEKLNPYVQFAVVDALTIQLDPGDGTVEPPPPPPDAPPPAATCLAECQMTNRPDLAPGGQCCDCNGVAGTMKVWSGGRTPPNSWKCLP